MATSRTQSEIFDNVKRKFNIESLTTNQTELIEAFMAEKDVFISTRTGSGKSLSYECVPVIYEGGTVLVIAPLKTIMTEQCNKLESLGFRATYIGKDLKEKEAIGNGDYDFVFTSPEHVVGKVTWRKVLMTSKFTQQLKLIAVEEGHTVLQWGEGNLQSDESPFREWFSKIGELRSLYPKIPMMAMTATASPLCRKRIMKTMNTDTEH